MGAHIQSTKPKNDKKWPLGLSSYTFLGFLTHWTTSTTCDSRINQYQEQNKINKPSQIYSKLIEHCTFEPENLEYFSIHRWYEIICFLSFKTFFIQRELYYRGKQLNDQSWRIALNNIIILLEMLFLRDSSGFHILQTCIELS